MAVLRPRNRIVYFRISQEEFHQLDTLCKTTEVGRSVSELSREAVRQLILNGHGGNGNHMPEAGQMGAALERMDNNVRALSEKLDEILQYLRLQQAAGLPGAARGQDKEQEIAAAAGDCNANG
jgi:hypothetical protein